MASLSELVVPWWSADSTPRQTIRLWRPWLREGKHEIATYRQAVAPALEPVFDTSNTGDAMLRNRLRHHLMPLLDELRPGATGALARFAELAAADDQLLNEIALAATSEMDRTPDGLPIAELAQLPLPLLRRAVRREMVAYGAASDVSAERVDALIQAVRGGRGNVTIEIGSGLRTSVAGGRLRFESSGAAG
jgi:tRNA(Ile)-lysidine synthase